VFDEVVEARADLCKAVGSLNRTNARTGSGSTQWRRSK
jgi:hypothetical protein